MATAAQAIEVGGKTAKELTSEVMAVLDDSMVMISGSTGEKLKTVVRYINNKKISARGETWFNKNYDRLAADVVETLISSRAKGITDYLNKQEQAEKDEAFRELVARGIAVPDAYKQVYK